ncbi:MAG: hypothetical protein HY401_10630, partial [Elusimicrobia bacterium]|nr:hypothetical protein [Elusimicrobiota bacterium]
INEETRLPLTLASGLAWHGFAGVALAADFKYRVYDQKTNWALGTEYGVASVLTVRGGYALADSRSRNSLAGLGGGFGLRFSTYKLDYAITPFGELGNTHRLSLTTRF